MLVETDIVLGDNQVESLCWLLDLYQLQNLHVVLVDLRGECVGTDVDDVNIGVLDGEDSHNLSILLLLQFLDRHALHLRDREGVDVDFNAFLLLDFGPAVLELFLHVPPDLPRLVIQLQHLHFC